MKAIIGLVVILVAAVAALFVMSTHTAVSLSPVSVIGLATPVTVKVANPHGEDAGAAFRVEAARSGA